MFVKMTADIEEELFFHLMLLCLLYLFCKSVGSCFIFYPRDQFREEEIRLNNFVFVMLVFMCHAYPVCMPLRELGLPLIAFGLGNVIFFISM